MKLSILLIGNEGFLGKWVETHYASTQDVTTCDILPSATSEQHFVLSEKLRPEDVVARQPFDWCINCAGAANVGASIEAPAHDFRLNTELVLCLLESLRKSNPGCRFLNISSAAVYGNPEQLPIKETANAAPISPYGYHKRMAELLCAEYHQVFGLPTCSVRVFSAYGPGLRKQLLWDTFQKMQADKEQIHLFGTGEETRDYIFASDIVQQLDLILRKADFNGGVINVANGEQITIRSVAENIRGALGYTGAIAFNGINRPGDPLYWQADISLVRQLGYQQEVTFEAGVKRFVQWAKQNYPL